LHQDGHACASAAGASDALAIVALVALLFLSYLRSQRREMVVWSHFGFRILDIVEIPPRTEEPKLYK
tara:strand:+ start:192 stop:392 length:201 start_codon:yes stop_codon:yes gene_type:complete